MASRWYRLGTIAATNGSRTITGTNTLWVTGNTLKPEPGDLFTVDFASVYEIEAITDDNTLLLFSNYQGTTATGSNYAIIRNASININTRIANMVTQALNQKQRMLDEFDVWLTEKVTDPVPIHDSLGNQLDFKPLPILIKEMTDLIDSGSGVIPGLVQEAKDAAALAKRWASDPEDTEVDGGLYSSFHYSRKASASETNAKASETSSATSAAEAAVSETNAKTSETNSATSETNAATSETNAETYKNQAETFKDEAAASATSAAASAVAAAGSETKAEQWANYSYNNVVPGETEYSSKHYSVVAYNEAERAKTYADSLNTVLVYQGTWDPNSGSYPPDQPSGFVGTQFYIVNRSGNFDSIDWNAGDNIIWNSTTNGWDRVEGAAVYEVNGKKGIVTLTSADIGFDNSGTNLTGTTTEAVIKELDNRAESSTTHAVSANYTIATSDLENFTYTVLNLTGGGYTITIPDYQAPFTAVIELIPLSALTGTVTLVAAGNASIISGSLTIPAGQFGYARLILAGLGPRGNVWIPNSGRYIGSDFSSGLALATTFDASGATHAITGDNVQTVLGNVLSGRFVDAVDADTVDGIQGASIVQTGGDQLIGGVKNFTNQLLVGANAANITNVSVDNLIVDHGAFVQSGTSNDAYIGVSSSVDNEWKSRFNINVSTNVWDLVTVSGAQPILRVGGHQVWSAGNDGAGSGLNADYLDGLEAASFVRADADDDVNGRTKWTNNTSIKVPAGGNSQRTPSAENGDFRYNTDTGSFEGYSAGAWGAIGGGGGGIAEYIVSSSSANVAAGEGYLFNVSGGALVATLPSSATAGDWLSVGIYSTAENVLTIASTLPIMGSSENFTLQTPYAVLTFSYVDSTIGWKIVNAVGESEAPDAVVNELDNFFVKGTDTFNINYTPGQVHVYVGGEKLSRQDFNAVDGSTVKLVKPLQIDSWVNIVAYNNLEIANLQAANVNYDTTGTDLTGATTQAAITELAGRSGGTPTYNVVTANTTGQKSEGYLMNCANGPLTLTLPVGQVGDWISIGDYNGTCSVINPITISAQGGQLVHSRDESIYLTNSNVVLTLSYIDATEGWKIVDGIGEGGNDAVPYEEVVILTPQVRQSSTLQNFNLPSGYTWGDFERVELFVGDANPAEIVCTSFTTKEHIATNGLNTTLLSEYQDNNNGTQYIGVVYLNSSTGGQWRTYGSGSVTMLKAYTKYRPVLNRGVTTLWTGSADSLNDVMSLSESYTDFDEIMLSINFDTSSSSSTHTMTSFLTVAMPVGREHAYAASSSGAGDSFLGITTTSGTALTLSTLISPNTWPRIGVVGIYGIKY